MPTPQNVLQMAPCNWGLFGQRRIPILQELPRYCLVVLQQGDSPQMWFGSWRSYEWMFLKKCFYHGMSLCQLWDFNWQTKSWSASLPKIINPRVRWVHIPSRYIYREREVMSAIPMRHKCHHHHHHSYYDIYSLVPKTLASLQRAFTLSIAGQQYVWPYPIFVWPYSILQTLSLSLSISLYLSIHLPLPLSFSISLSVIVLPPF